MNFYIYLTDTISLSYPAAGRLPAAFFRLPVAVFVGTDPAQKAGGLQLFHVADDGADGKAGLLRQFALRDKGIVFDAVQNSLLTGG